MAKKIITISREFGSGGRFIGEEVAKKLGIAYYDKNIIGQIAEKSGLSPEYIQEINCKCDFLFTSSIIAKTFNDYITAIFYVRISTIY